MTTNPPRPVLRCPACDEPVVTADHCARCGARLDVRTASSSQAAPPAGPCVRCGATGTSPEGYCDRCGQRRPAGRDRVECDLGLVAGVSDKGHLHQRNEDAMAFGHITVDGEVIVAAVVCDGVSVSERPDEASQVAADTGLSALLDAVRCGTDHQQATVAAGRAAAAAVAALDAGRPGPAPSCTYVSALVTATTVTVGWTGDSRAYWLALPAAAQATGPPTPAACLTVDDSWAGLMVIAGILDPAQAYADRRAHALVRWFGADTTDVEPHVVSIRPTSSGVVLVCTDGLWNYLGEADALAAAVLPDALAEPLQAARALTQLALDSGGHDNITVTVVPFPPAAAAADQPPAGEHQDQAQAPGGPHQR